MKSESLLDKAMRNLGVAQFLLQKLDDGDEGILNHVAYQLQQSAELFLKHYLETESTGYPFSHDINLLIDLVEERGLDVRLTEEFKLIAGSLTEWEAKARDVKDYLASRRAVFRAMEILQEVFAQNGLEVERVDTAKYGTRGQREIRD